MPKKSIAKIVEGKDKKLASGIAKKKKGRSITLKFKAWTAFFMDSSNKATWGNATQSALKAYNTKDYQSAAVIGHDNLNKLKEIAKSTLDADGIGFGELMKIGTDKMKKGSYQDWEAFMERIGYFKPKVKGGDNTFNFNNLNLAISQDRRDRGLE
jgi:hypothetical protein